MPDNPLGLFGVLPGALSLIPGAAPQVPSGVARPLGRGEYLNNPNGSWSNEMSYTLQDPMLNAGRPTIVPGLWVKDGKPYHATEDEAARMALASLLHFPSYNSMQQAEDMANAREAAWQKIPKEKSAMAAPLYIPPLLPRLPAK